MMVSTNYCKPENFRPRVIFAPFTLNISGRIKDCANSIVSDHLFFKTQLGFGEFKARRK